MKLCIGVFLVAITFAPFAVAETSPVDAAITKAQAWLLANERNGNWESLGTSEYVAQQTGWTAIALNALLSSGFSSQDPRIVAAVKYLEKTDTNGVYALGCRLQVWMRLPPSAEVRQCALKDAHKLVTGTGTRSDAKGMYAYEVGGTSYSHSRSQYGVLGMSAARQMGIDVPDSYWKLIAGAWADHQLTDGGWTYQREASDTHPPTAGMTSAGVASLYLAVDALQEGVSLDCRGNTPPVPIVRGLKWLADHSDEIANGEATPRNYPYSALYGVERVGAAAGTKYFGKVNWLSKGTAWLLANQEADGSWRRSGRDDSSMTSVADTAFGLLFLAHGKSPVFMEKLDYSTDPTKTSEWNQRPRDLANLTHHTGEELEQELSWQVVTLDSPVDDYHDAPILYVSGKDPIKLTDAVKTKLRDFVQGGGMIVANADCGGIGFANSFRKLATDISPYEFRVLSQSHPIFTRQQFPASRWKTKTTLYGLSNGVRELMILIPNGDPGKTWELDTVNGHEPVWELGADLFEYVASRTHLRARGESYVVARDNSLTAKNTITIGRVQYGGNWDPEPGGWRRLANLMHNQQRIDLDVRPISINADLHAMPMLHLTGTQIFHPGEETKQHLKDYVTNGGTLIVDAAGGSVDFVSSFEAELVKTFGSALTLIPPDDVLYSAGGTKLSPVKYREFETSFRGKLDQPRVKGLKIGNRWAVIFSEDDLSAGLVGQQVDGVLGYTPECATDIMEHIINYADKK